MIAFFYQWLQNIAFYLILITAIIQIIPNHSYKKYIRFFTGLILIILLSEPILKAVGMQMTFSELYDSAAYKQKIREIEETTKYLEGISLEGIEKEEAGAIEVEEIRIENGIEME